MSGFVDMMYNNVYNIVRVLFLFLLEVYRMVRLKKMITPNEHLRRARLRKRWSVTTASRRVGVSTNTFNRWERGLQVPQLATLGQLMEAFEMSAEDLGFGFVISPREEGDKIAPAEARMSLVSLSSQKTPDGMSEQRGMEKVEEAVLVMALPGQATSRIERPTGLSYGIESAKPPYVQPVAVAQAAAESLSRRQVIAALIGTPAAVFCARQGDNLSLLRAEEILTLCASHIPLCWQLYFEGGQAEVEQVLPNYISQLSALARHPSSYQKRAATLLSQAYQLASLLATQHQDYGAAYTAARQGLFYGEVAGDPNLQVASFVRQAMVYFYLKRARPRLQTYQSALQLVSSTSPLLQGQVSIGLAEVYSKLGQESEARRFLELAYKAFPENAEDDPSYAYTHFSSASTFEGRMYLNLGRPEQAVQAFGRVDRMLPTGPVPLRLELIVRQAAAACALGELEQTCEYLKTAVTMGRDLGSQLRVDESYELYESMLGRWGGEPMVRELEELFH